MNNEINVDLTIKDKLFEFIDLNLRNVVAYKLPSFVLNILVFSNSFLYAS